MVAPTRPRWRWSLAPVNDAPVDPDDTNTVTEDTPLTVDAGAGLLNGATDTEGNPLSVVGLHRPGLTGTQTIGVPVCHSWRGLDHHQQRWQLQFHAAAQL